MCLGGLREKGVPEALRKRLFCNDCEKAWGTGLLGCANLLHNEGVKKRVSIGLPARVACYLST